MAAEPHARWRWSSIRATSMPATAWRCRWPRKDSGPKRSRNIHDFSSIGPITSLAVQPGPGAARHATFRRGSSRLSARFGARPRARQGLVDLGIVLFALGQLDDAHACYLRALEVAPHSADAHNNLAVLALHYNRLDEAERHARRAIALVPNRGEAHFTLAMALLVAGRMAEGCANMSGARSASTNMPGFGSHSGSAGQSRDKRSCCAANRDWVTRCSSSVTRGSSNSRAQRSWSSVKSHSRGWSPAARESIGSLSAANRWASSICSRRS